MDLGGESSEQTEVKQHCYKCSLKHRNILAKTADAALSNWFVNLADEDPEEYKKVLVSSAPEPGAKRSKFSLAQYKEETVQKKIRAEREGMVLMDFTRYCQFHQHEVFPTSERMTASEAGWVCW